MVIGPCGANIRKICHEAEVIAFLFTLFCIIALTGSATLTPLSVTS
jgi:hypothetical protein